jgi:hypothetical protein
MLIIYILKAYLIYFTGVIPSMKMLMTYVTTAIFIKLVVEVFGIIGTPREYSYMNRKIVAEIEG